MSCGCTDPCQPNSIPCTCEARVTSDCVTVSGATSNCLAIDDNLLLTDYLTQMDERICEKVDSVTNFIALENVGTGSQLYKGDSLLGKKQIRTVKSLETALIVTETDDEIQLDLNISAIIPPDETTSSIQTKRPLKTIEGQSLEGVGDINLNKSDVGLGNVDNTSDLNKPISTATQTVLNDLQLNKEDKGVNSSKIAYVESVGNDTTAELGNFRKPFLTIDAALDALPATGGVINIGVGSFMSPTKTKIKSYVKFFGSGKPVTNSIYTYTPGGYRATISSPTKLIGGTILLGTVEVSSKDGVEFHKLGVDSGLDYCNAYKAGVAQEGLIIVQEYNLAGGLPSADRLHQLQTNSSPRTGIVVNNVSALCKSANSAVHAILIENTINAKISNVSTYYGIHGLVIKSIGCNLNGLDAHGHAANGLIFKANDYAYGEQNSATNIYITSIEDYDGGGIHFVSEHRVLSFVTLTNFNVEFTTYGIMNTSIGGMYTEGHTISNGVIYETQGVGIDIDSTFLNSVFSNIDQRRGEVGYLIYQDHPIYRTSLCFINCKSSENTNTGWNITANNLSEVYLNNCIGQSGVLGSIVSGNVFGTLHEMSSLTGSMNKSAIAGDFIASIDSKGVSKKSSATFDGVGGINVTGLLIKKSASNNIGDGSNVSFDNGASGGLQRQIVCQLNASNNMDLWYYNGSVFSLTGIVFKNTGVIKSKVYTVSTLPDAEKGDTSFVSDALSPVFGNTVVGGGAVGVPVYHDGISWKVG